MADETVGSDELEKARSMIKGRFVLRTESPQGLIMYGLNREVLEGHVLEPTELVAKIDAVTAADVQRVAQDLIAKEKMRLAVIGPFEGREEHFAGVLA
jgi:predicted Zn-dependent peptidase